MAHIIEHILNIFAEILSQYLTAFPLSMSLNLTSMSNSPNFHNISDGKPPLKNMFLLKIFYLRDSSRYLLQACVVTCKWVRRYRIRIGDTSRSYFSDTSRSDFGETSRSNGRSDFKKCRRRGTFLPDWSHFRDPNAISLTIVFNF